MQRIGEKLRKNRTNIVHTHLFTRIKHYVVVVLFVAVSCFSFALGGQPRNSRNINSKILVREQSALNANAALRRAATSVIARSTNVNARRSKNVVVTARPAINRAASNVSARSGTRVVSNPTNLSRATVSKNALQKRSAVDKSGKMIKAGGHLSRAGKSRVTAIFNDVTKIGGGYASCRDAYATCMDQFCANADDTYRRCFCSDKFMDLRDTMDNLNEALGLLSDFQNNNLNAINKTAAEVNAMYSSTIGENAIKKDTSASQKMLDSIGDILSGKKTKSKSYSTNSTSLGVLDFGSLSDLGDIWSSSGSGLFNTNSADSLSGLEGQALYKRAGAQCADVVGTSCTGDSMFNLASSAYSVMVTQDCNLLEKTVNAKRESVMQTVRQAEKVLREARLEEYRAHNSQDVNECLNKVEEAMTNNMACGPNYEKCLDYTGLYINASTGEPIYHELFNLTSISPNLGDADVITANPKWNEFFENKKDRANTALDTCRSLADEVWTEYKRMTIIKIAQAQDDKIEAVKDTCVNVIKECYNTTDGTLAELNSESDDSKYDTSANRAVAVRGMCYDKVVACASLYGGDPDGCEYDRAVRKIKAKGDKKCGLQSLLSYVDAVDSSKIAKGCETSLSEYAHELCGPERTSSTSSSDTEDDKKYYPMGCADMSRGDLRSRLMQHAETYCALDAMQEDTSNPNSKNSTLNVDAVNNVLRDIFDSLGLAFTIGCENTGGVWYNDGAVASWAAGSLTIDDLNKDFYDTYYGGTSLQSILDSIKGKQGDIGVCVKASAKDVCVQLFGESAYSTGECIIPQDKLSDMCKWLNDGDLSSGQCKIPD